MMMVGRITEEVKAHVPVGAGIPAGAQDNGATICISSEKPFSWGFKF
jgi:hypothetical protein